MTGNYRVLADAIDVVLLSLCTLLLLWVGSKVRSMIPLFKLYGEHRRTHRLLMANPDLLRRVRVPPMAPYPVRSSNGPRWATGGFLAGRWYRNHSD